MRGILKTYLKHNWWPVKTAKALCTWSRRLVWWNLIHFTMISVVLLSLKAKGQKLLIAPRTASIPSLFMCFPYLESSPFRNDFWPMKPLALCTMIFSLLVGIWLVLVGAQYKSMALSDHHCHFITILTYKGVISWFWSKLYYSTCDC